MPRASSAKQRSRGKATESRHPTPIIPASVFVWAQCDNAGCQKWRKLPPNTKIEEDVPWFCYMNPDPEKDTCSAPEEGWNVEAEEGHDAISGLGEASSQVPSSSRATGSASRAKAAADPARAEQRRAGLQGHQEQPAHATHPMLQGKRQRTGLRYQDLEAQEASLAVEHPHSDAAGDLGGLGSEPKLRVNRFRRGQKAHKAQQGFDKLLAGGGEWEIVKGRGRAITPAPAYIWDALANYAPLAAEIAAAASNAASAAKYFEDPLDPQSDTHVQAAQLTCRSSGTS
ncbi:hypothetical protein WJX73_009835 [Symbiochloris irregularis]|uniref:CW-type domain-containing protein n=1 Tax=Symbiochloris irregularis TaxID=706552 RepID=A0AAW1NVA5_9CHLO